MDRERGKEMRRKFKDMLAREERNNVENHERKRNSKLEES